MNSQSTMETSKEIVSEACAWIAQLESGNLSASDLAALREWMGRSPAHRREIRNIANLSGQLGVLTELAPALEKNAGVGHALRTSGKRGRFLAPILASAAALFIAGGVIVSALLFSANARPEIYKTAVGEYHTITLADGTDVSLNTDSQIEVDFNDEERRVRLIHGEALFEVASNPKRPFVVYSDTAIAEAVGTSFVVRLREAVTELAVVEGVVAFSKLPSSIDLTAPQDATERVVEEPPAQRVIVKAGQALTSSELASIATASAAQDIPVLTERDLQRKLSWTDGFLEFSETPLEDVIEELTRHNPVSIEIVDPDLKELKFGGIFRTGDVEQLLGALEGLGVVVERESDDKYQLRMAKAE